MEYRIYRAHLQQKGRRGQAQYEQQGNNQAVTERRTSHAYSMRCIIAILIQLGQNL
jgi:hypothetical protein